MKPFLLLCADPPPPHVAAGLAHDMRVTAVGTAPGTLAPMLAALDTPFRARELIPVDSDTLTRGGLKAALTAERKMPSRELLIRGAVGYTGMPEAAILYSATDLIHLAEAARRANRRPSCLGLRGGHVSQTEILFDLGYRDIVLHRDKTDAFHILATNEDMSDSGAAPSHLDTARLRALRVLVLSLLTGDADQTD